jgi:hypothetical protein
MGRFLTIVKPPARDLPATELPRDAGCPCCQTTNRTATLGSAGLTLLGITGWLALPKCPLCLAAYLTIATGFSVTALQGRAVYFALATLVVACVLTGVVSVGRLMRR